VLVSIYYFPAAFAAASSQSSAKSLVVLSVIGVIALVVIETIYHVFIAIPHGADADRTDERDRLIDLKAERNASLVLGIALFWLVGHIVFPHLIGVDRVPSSLNIAVWILAALTLSEVAKLVSQIWFYRADA
jgi:riboflavin transporter FmnP